jgi:hypothetical protein
MLLQSGDLYKTNFDPFEIPFILFMLLLCSNIYNLEKQNWSTYVRQLQFFPRNFDPFEIPFILSKFS